MKTDPLAATVVTAVEMSARQREISVSESFTKNRHLLGFDNPRKALLVCVKEAVTTMRGVLCLFRRHAGSINLALESQRTQFSKLRPSDSPAPILNCADFRNGGINLNEKDIVRAKELLSYEWFQKPVWQAEIKRMLTCGPTYALAALATKTFSMSRRHIFQ